MIINVFGARLMCKIQALNGDVQSTELLSSGTLGSCAGTWWLLELRQERKVTGTLLLTNVFFTGSSLPPLIMGVFGEKSEQLAELVTSCSCSLGRHAATPRRSEFSNYWLQEQITWLAPRLAVMQWAVCDTGSSRERCMDPLAIIVWSRVWPIHFTE